MKKWIFVIYLMFSLNAIADMQEVYNKTYLSVFKIIEQSNMGRELSEGTGFFLKIPSGRVVIASADHLCDSGRILKFVYGRFTSERLSTIKRGDFTDNTDACILTSKELENRGTIPVYPLELAKNKPKNFSFSFYLGYPRGYFMQNFGIILPASANNYQNSDSVFSFKSDHGASGSPILNSEGEVISILTSIEEYSPFRTFGVEYYKLVKFLTDL